MNKNIVIAIVLGALIIIAGVQAFSLMGLKSKLGSGVQGASVAATSGQGGGANLPSNLQNLPQMVGGC